MTDWVLWTRGLRGPSISVLRGRTEFTEHERRLYLSGPFKIAPEHDGLSLPELARLYPPPAPPDPPESAHAPLPDAPLPSAHAAQAA